MNTTFSWHYYWRFISFSFHDANIDTKQRHLWWFPNEFCFSNIVDPRACFCHVQREGPCLPHYLSRSLLVRINPLQGCKKGSVSISLISSTNVTLRVCRSLLLPAQLILLLCQLSSTIGGGQQTDGFLWHLFQQLPMHCALLNYYSAAIAECRWRNFGNNTNPLLWGKQRVAHTMDRARGQWQFN